jgi:plastocyanin
MTEATIARRLLAPAVAAVAAAALLVPAVPAVPAAAAVGAAPARAASGVSVSVANMAFTPASVTLAVGQTVTWTFPDSMAHTTTSNQGFWDSGTKLNGATYTRAFTSAGTFTYHCSIHSTMRGTVRVSVTASGSPGAGWKLRWSTTKGKDGITFDVQTRLGSGKWISLKASVTGTTAKFNPAKSGNYQVRARTLKGAARSGWSPAVTVNIS